MLYKHPPVNPQPPTPTSVQQCGPFICTGQDVTGTGGGTFIFRATVHRIEVLHMDLWINGLKYTEKYRETHRLGCKTSAEPHITCTSSVVSSGKAASLGHHALHPERFLRMVEAKEG